jgi:hypothetical protein
MEFQYSLTKANVSFIVPLLIVELNGIFGIAYGIQLTVVSLSQPNWMGAYREFFKITVLSFDVVLMLLLFISLLVILKIIKGKKQLQGNMRVIIPHFLVMFSGVISVVAVLCQYKIPSSNLEDVLSLDTYLHLFYVSYTAIQIKFFIIAFIMA